MPGSNADANPEVFFFDAKTGLSQITDTTGGFALFPAVDGRGKRLAFVSNRDLLPGSNPDLNLELFVFDPKNGFTQVTDSTGGES